MKFLNGIALIGLVCASTADAQTSPVPGPGDPRLQTVDYNVGQIVQLRGATGFQLMIELSPDEEVLSIALGDSAAWQVSVNKGGDRLFLKPNQSDIATNMTVVTSVRVYNFDLYAESVATPEMPYTVQFRYPVQPDQDAQYGDASLSARRLSKYKVSGDRLLRPTSITDDGKRTFITWPEEAPIPAIYAHDSLGNEVVVNGMMGTDDVFVIDGAPQRLIFRIDRSVARAERIKARRR